MQEQPSRLIFPVGVHHVQHLLELAGLTLTQKRDMLICVLGTVACMREGGVSNLQLCYCRWNHDVQWSAVYDGTMALRIYKRKQDQVRKGLNWGSTRGSGRRYPDGSAPSPKSSVWKCQTSAPRRGPRVTNAVVNSRKMTDVETKHSSRLSTQRGGISAALVARVPEPVLFLQSGHGSNCAARNYTVQRNPNTLFETYNAFGL